MNPSHQDLIVPSLDVKGDINDMVQEHEEPAMRITRSMAKKLQGQVQLALTNHGPLAISCDGPCTIISTQAALQEAAHDG